MSVNLLVLQDKEVDALHRPPVWQREHLCRFWRAIAAGLSSEDAS